MIKEYLLNGTEPALFVACFLVGCLGILFTLLMGTTLRDKDSGGSPIGFSWSYLWSDNFKRIILSVVTLLISIIFSPQIFNAPLELWHGLVAGVSWDAISLLIKQKTTILDPKEK
jgi:uncharacterized membrane protein YjjB (DUF3815 family)